MVTQNAELGFFAGDIDQYQVIHVITDEDSVVGIGVIVVGVERHVYTLDNIALTVSQANKRRHDVLIHLHVLSDSLRAVRCNRSVMAGTSVVKEDKTILRPELVADGIELILAEARFCLAGGEV